MPFDNPFDSPEENFRLFFGAGKTGFEDSRSCRRSPAICVNFSAYCIEAVRYRRERYHLIEGSQLEGRLNQVSKDSALRGQGLEAR